MLQRTVYRSLLLALLLSVVACQQVPTGTLTVAAASNMQFALDSLSTVFRSETGTDVHVILGSSGKLSTQIMQGAPFDLLLSADPKYAQALKTEGRAAAEPRIFAYGSLVLWTLDKEISPGWPALQSPRIRHIALANPDIAPFGRAAVEAMQYYRVADALRPKWVFGESVSQSNPFILSGAAEIGFTAKSVVLSPTMKARGSWVEIEPEAYAPIAHVAVIVSEQESKRAQANRFVNFLFSERGAKILMSFGYRLPQPINGHE